MEQQDSLRFPFLGIREDGEPFEYMLMEMQPEKVSIAIFNWLVDRTNLNLEENVNLFIPETLTHIYKFRKETSGIVSNQKRENDGFFYEIVFPKEILPHAPQGTAELIEKVAIPTSLTEMLARLIKDSAILKDGIIVYLRHLAPYFSRIVGYNKENFQALENYIFDDLHKRVKKNAEYLLNLYHSIKHLKDPNDIILEFTLEQLRECIESELGIDLFLVAFSNLESPEELLELLKASKYEDKLRFRYFYMNYLLAIKDLEKRLYSNYNQIVLLYLKSLSASTQE